MLEIIAVILAVAYLLLAARENILCWYCAFVSSGIYVVVFWDVGLLMESMLNVFYVLMAVVGWLQWKYGGRDKQGLPIRTLAAWQHLAIVTTMILLALANGWWLRNNTLAVWPLLDSFTTWAGVITTFMVVFKILENWIYWFVIDSISIYLYVDRELYLTALLFVAYVIIVVFGFLNWRRLLREQEKSAVK